MPFTEKWIYPRNSAVSSVISIYGNNVACSTYVQVFAFLLVASDYFLLVIFDFFIQLSLVIILIRLPYIKIFIAIEDYISVVELASILLKNLL
jgi:hypothetical protein